MTIAKILALISRGLGEQLHYFAAQLLALDLKKRLMHEIRMVTVDPVLHLEFPVAIIAILVRTATWVDLSLGRQIHKQVNIILCTGQMLGNFRDLWIETGKDQPPINADSRANEAEFAAVEAFSIAARIRQPH